MGICLALSVLEHGYTTEHGGRNSAIEELINERFWMTEGELSRAHALALKHSPFLELAIDAERSLRRANAPVCHRNN